MSIDQQVERLEERFDDHAKRMETRLDKLVTLMETVAQLQERDRHQSESISRCEADVRNLSSDIKALHQKIEQRTRAVSLDVDKRIQALKVEQGIGCESIRGELNTTTKLVTEYQNKGWGVWKTLTTLSALFCAIACAWVSALLTKVEDVERRMYAAEASIKVEQVKNGERK